MESAFVIVVFAVAVVGVLGAIVTLLLREGTWEAIGRNQMLMDSELRDPRTPTRPVRGAPATPATPAARAERDAEIRQMLEARNARRRRRGEPELDVAGELARLTASGGVPRSGPGPLGAPASSDAPGSPGGPGVDEELRAEIRQLVIARNHRRARRGQPPLEVEAEVAREIGRLSG